MIELKEENKDYAIIIYRFSSKKWMDEFRKGNFSFSCPGKYIEESLIEGNDEQGDKYEAVFARLKKDDSRIDEMKKRLGHDLEIIDDGRYVLLRRESAKLIPTFCFFYYKEDNLHEGAIREEKNGLVPITLYFDDKMYSGFADGRTEEEKLTVTAIYTNEFVEKAKQIIFSVDGRKFHAKMGGVDYKKRAEDTFFIDPNDSYDELFYKRPKYAYQHEGRIALPGFRLENIHERVNYQTEPFRKENWFETQEVPFKLTFYCNAKK